MSSNPERSAWGEGSSRTQSRKSSVIWHKSTIKALLQTRQTEQNWCFLPSTGILLERMIYDFLPFPKVLPHFFQNLLWWLYESDFTQIKTGGGKGDAHRVTLSKSSFLFRWGLPSKKSGFHRVLKLSSQSYEILGYPTRSEFWVLIYLNFKFLWIINCHHTEPEP